MNGIITSYFSFTKKERHGIIALLIGILSLILLPFTYSLVIQPKTTDISQFEEEITALQIKIDTTKKFELKNFDEDKYKNYYQPNNKNFSPAFTGQMSYFDPNTLSAEGWEKMGIKEKTIQTIQKYLSKGGKFYQPKDIEKIWGLRPDEIERLQPYIQIHQNETATNNFTNKKYEKPFYTPTSIDINTADTSALIALPGIGSKLAQRIITFREKLGGFYKPEQIAETFGLPDSIYQKIKSRFTINNIEIKKININTTTIEQLKTHPYIRYNIGNAIIQYRNQHGNFNAVEDIKKIVLIDEETYNKIAPYLTIN